MSIIEVRNLYFSYKKKEKKDFIHKKTKYEKEKIDKDKYFELQNISFNIFESEILCILGPNGSGKTTLLKIIAKINKADAGSVYLDGKNINEFSIRQYSKKVHYIPQNPLTTFDFNVLDTIVMGINSSLGFFEFPSKIHYQKALSLLEEFGYEYLKDKNLKQLSGGEIQMVFFLRSLIDDAKILIFDEPTAFLDFKNQSKILEVIKKISKQKKTIIVSLHDPNHVLRISDKVLLLKEGKIFSIGKAEDVLIEKNLSDLYEYPIKRIKGESCDEYFFKM